MNSPPPIAPDASPSSPPVTASIATKTISTPSLLVKACCNGPGVKLATNTTPAPRGVPSCLQLLPVSPNWTFAARSSSITIGPVYRESPYNEVEELPHLGPRRTHEPEAIIESTSLFGLPALGIAPFVSLLAAPVNLMDACRVSKTYTLTRPALGGLMSPKGANLEEPPVASSRTGASPAFARDWTVRVCIQLGLSTEIQCLDEPTLDRGLAMAGSGMKITPAILKSAGST
ncbi:hypothetical protein CPB85DRAFT_1254699 [Mucidula mucida]|nr:hypothetical protein CPB85DRAFT_1254699 [Mucidula mucida]